MTSDAVASGNVCYRHPDRQSYILCQRCGRTICSECQTQAPVGVHCPECVREARASAPRTKPAIVTTMTSKSAPVVTYTLIALCVIVFAIELLVPAARQYLPYYPQLTLVFPWGLVTSMFSHSVAYLPHILFNMLTLFLFGRVLEPMLGRARFLVLYLLSGLGGSVAVMLLQPDGSVIGASGAIFGLLGGFFVIQRRLGFSNPTLLIIIAINLGLGFILPSISWQAHLGGLVVGALVALIYMRTRHRAQRQTQALLTAAVGVGLFVILFGVGFALDRFVVF